MKRKIVFLLISLLMLFSISLTVSACSCSCSTGYSVSVSYDETMGIVEGIGKYKANTEVSLSALPNEGYVFDGWYSGTYKLSSDSVYVFTMPKNAITFIAKFALEPTYAVTIDYDDEKGIVAGEGNYKNQQQVVLTATPNEGYLFDGWYVNNQKVSSNSNYEFTMGKEQVNITASFVVDNIDRVLTIKYVYQDGSKAYDSYVGNYKFKNTYEVASPSIDGYTADITTVTGTIKENTTLTVTYSVNKYNLIIKYVDENSNPMSQVDTYTQEYDYKSSYNVTSPTITGYTADKLEVTGTMQLNGVEVIVTYSRNPYTLSIEYVGAGDFTPQSYSQGYSFGDAYSVNTPEIIGFTADKAVVEGTISEDTVITVTYTAKVYKLTINCLKNDDTTTLGTKIVENLIYNSNYQIDLDNFETEFYYLDNYSIGGVLNVNDSLLGDVLSNATTTDISIDITYTNHNRVIPVKYVDTEGEEIIPASSISKLIGETYDVSAEDIEGYTPINASLTGTITADISQEIVFVYTINTYKLTINYVYENGSTAADTYTEDINYNSDYSVTSPSITGYTADKLVVEGNIGKDPVVITVTYSVIKTGLTIKYLYENGNKAADQYYAQISYNESYSVTSPVITGYTADKLVVSGTMKLDSVVVTVTYTINSYTLTINYVSDVAGFASVKPTSIVETLNYNASYTYNTPSISGLKADKSVVSGKMGASNETITVTYTLADATLTLSYVTKSGTTTNYIQSANKTHTIDFANKTKTIQIENPYVWNNVGYRPKYTSLKLQILNKNLQLVGISGSTQELIYDNISNSCSYALEFEKIVSTVTVQHRLDKSSIFPNTTETYTGDYNTKITLTYRDFGVGYIPAGTTLEYTFKANNETINLEYSSVVKKLTINYVDIYGDKVTNSYVANLKYNTKYNVTSPELADYILADTSKSVISGTMGITDLTFDVVYNLNWDTDSSDDLIVDTPLKLLELSKNTSLWNRNVKVTKNIDMTGYKIAPIGNYANPFTGDVNGGNYTISNVTINTDKVVLRTQVVNSVTYKYAYVGLFGCAYGSIDNLNVSGINITYSLASTEKVTVYAGLLVGQYSGYSISKVNLTGTLNVCANVAYVGGVAGSNLSGQIIDAITNVTIAGTGTITSASLSGLVGINYTGTIADSRSTLTINTLVADSSLKIGGVVAESNEGFITNCSSTLNISNTGVTCQNASIVKNNICADNKNTIISN